MDFIATLDTLLQFLEHNTLDSLSGDILDRLVDELDISIPTCEYVLEERHMYGNALSDEQIAVFTEIQGNLSLIAAQCRREMHQVNRLYTGMPGQPSIIIHQEQVRIFQ